MPFQYVDQVAPAPAKPKGRFEYIPEGDTAVYTPQRKLPGKPDLANIILNGGRGMQPADVDWENPFTSALKRHGELAELPGEIAKAIPPLDALGAGFTGRPMPATAGPVSRLTYPAGKAIGDLPTRMPGQPLPDRTRAAVLGQVPRVTRPLRENVNAPLVPGPQITPDRMPAGTFGKAYAEGYNAIMRNASGLTTLQNAALLTFAPEAPAPARQLIDAWFIKQMGPAAYQQAKQGIDHLRRGDIPKATGSFVGAGFDATFTGLMAKGLLEGGGPAVNKEAAGGVEAGGRGAAGQPAGQPTAAESARAPAGDLPSPPAVPPPATAQVQSATEYERARKAVQELIHGWYYRPDVLSVDEAVEYQGLADGKIITKEQADRLRTFLRSHKTSEDSYSLQAMQLDPAAETEYGQGVADLVRQGTDTVLGPQPDPDQQQLPPAPTGAPPAPAPSPVKSFGQSVGELIEKQVKDTIGEQLKAAGITPKPAQPVEERAVAGTAGPATPEAESDETRRVAPGATEAQPAVEEGELPEGVATTSTEGRQKTEDRRQEAASTQPAGLKLSKPAAPGGAEDLVDLLKAEGVKINVGRKTAMGAMHRDWTKEMYSTYHKVRSLFTTQGGQTLDKVAQLAANRGWIADGDVETLKAALEKSGGRTAASFERAQNAADKKAYDFDKAVTVPTRATQPVRAEDLKIGDTFTLKGEKFRVTGIDPDTLDVIVQDGKRFGRQVLQGDATFQADRMSVEAGRQETGDRRQEAAGKEAWQMTRAQYITARSAEYKEKYGRTVTAGSRALQANHRDAVEIALKYGKPVPPEVLADYPDLKRAAFDKLKATVPKQPPTDQPGIVRERADKAVEDVTGHDTQQLIDQRRRAAARSGVPVDEPLLDTTGAAGVPLPRELPASNRPALATTPPSTRPSTAQTAPAGVSRGAGGVGGAATAEPTALRVFRQIRPDPTAPTGGGTLSRQQIADTYPLAAESIGAREIIVGPFRYFTQHGADILGHTAGGGVSAFPKQSRQMPEGYDIEAIAAGRGPGWPGPRAAAAVRESAEPYSLESPTEDQLNAEKAKAAEKAELQRRADAKLEGGPIDTTGDLLDRTQADNPLFAPPAPKPKPGTVREGPGAQTFTEKPSKLGTVATYGVGRAKDVVGAGAKKAEDLVDQARDYVSLDPVPLLTKVSQPTADAARRLAYARSAVPFMVDDVQSRVLPEHYADPAVDERVGEAAVIDSVLGGYENLKRALQGVRSAQKNARVEFEAARKDLESAQDSRGLREATNNQAIKDARYAADIERLETHIKDVEEAQPLDKMEARIKELLADNVVADAMKRHVALVNPELDAMFNTLKRVDPSTRRPGRGKYTGIRVNLLSKKREADVLGWGNAEKAEPDARPPTIFAKNVKRDPFDKRALLTGDYSTSYRAMMMNTYGRRWANAKKIEFYDQLIASGAAIEEPMADMRQEGWTPPAKIQGHEAVREQVPMPETDATGLTRLVPKNIWIRKDLHREVRGVLATDLPGPRHPIATALNWIQLKQIADPVAHLKNQHSVVASAPGTRSAWLDAVRKFPLIGTADWAVRMAKTTMDLQADTPASRAKLAGMAKEGLLREIFPGRGPADKLIRNADLASRVILNDFFTENVKRGNAVDTPGNRAKFVGQIGEYNRRLMGPMAAWLKQTGISPFIVAGRQFNRAGRRMITGHPGFEAPTAGRAAAVRAQAIAARVVGVMALPAMLNVLTTGSVGGRAGTPVGAWDLGQQEKDGKHTVVDFMQLVGMRRGLKSVGLHAAIEGARAGKSGDRILGEALMDVQGSALHPWIGPAPGFAVSALTGAKLDMRGGPQPVTARNLGGPTSFKQHGEYARTALQNQNILLYSLLAPVIGDKTQTFGERVKTGLTRAPMSAVGLQELKSPAAMMASEALRAQGATGGYTERQDEHYKFRKTIADLMLTNRAEATAKFQEAFRNGEASVADAKVIAARVASQSAPVGTAVKGIHDNAKVLEAWNAADDREKSEIRKSLMPLGAGAAVMRTTSGRRAVLIYSLANDDEKRRIRNIVAMKLKNDKQLTGDEKESMRAELQGAAAR